ncbi:MAG: hypothetical protein ACI89J_002487 [Hyphomicrobiaceae bacterium]|jgi:hypothetical protein
MHLQLTSCFGFSLSGLTHLIQLQASLDEGVCSLNDLRAMGSRAAMSPTMPMSMPYRNE